jgi:hypothetical protein
VSDLSAYARVHLGGRMQQLPDFASPRFSAYAFMVAGNLTWQCWSEGSGGVGSFIQSFVHWVDVDLV